MAEIPRDLVAVIMAGGAGTRFWPLSTNRRPKQFHALFGERSMIQLSLDRLSGLVPPERTIVMTNADFVPLVREQLPEIPADNVIGEPYRRDTAAAVCLAALLVRARHGDAVIATLTADHLIEPVSQFQTALLSAARAAADGGTLYTFGIRPTFAATGYGYLETGTLVKEEAGVRHFELASFKEKPKREVAQAYVQSGRYLWNSGMFVWTASAILHELREYLPGHVVAFERAIEHDRSSTWETMLAESFLPLTSISIDFAVMEKARNVRCVESTFAWSDVGGWHALSEHLPEDGQRNRHRAHLVALDSHDNLVFCERPSDTVMLVGVHDLIVVHAGGRMLVTTKERAEEIKQLVKELDIDE